MYQELKKHFTRPLLWQRTEELFWDDPYISKQMLKSHLDPNVEAASRREEDIARSIEWLSTVFPRNAKILDLGCGPGLYTSRFSEMGYDVTGVDLSPNSIRYAMENDDKTNYICKNYLDLDITETFDVITLIYCDYAALTRAEREKLLSKVKKLLRPHGLFIFDVFSTKAYEGKTECQGWYACDKDGFWSNVAHICFEATYLYEQNTVSADQYVVVTNESMKEYIIWDTTYTTKSLTEEIEAAGLCVKSLYGDICGKSYDEGSETICCVATRNDSN